uniref:Uncharacterized protein n=1 Tax=Rangifer tarandus platyrhynchus TaxID=3082113 RepID=A0ACB0EBD4_RANTA|nr:unnamed protein product [Rangifer tarandus platyrhynchus]
MLHTQEQAARGGDGSRGPEPLMGFSERKHGIQVAAFSLLGKRAGAAVLGGARGRKLACGFPGVVPFDPLRILLHLQSIDYTVSTLY